MDGSHAPPRSLYWAMGLQFAVGGAVMPFISILLHDRGLSFAEISQVFLAGSSTSLIFPFLWGVLADRFLPIDRLFAFLNLFAAVALAMLLVQQELVGIIICYTFFYAVFHPTLTLINALSFRHLPNPSAQFGILRAWGSAGWTVPSLPIGIWIATRENKSLEFTLLLGIGLSVAMAVLGFFLPHTPPGAGPGAKRAAGGVGEFGYVPAIGKLLRNTDYIVILVSFFLMSASFSLHVYYSPPYLEQHGIARAWIGPIQCIGVALEILLFWQLPRLSRRWNYAGLIVIGCCALALRHLLFAFWQNPWVLSASYLLAGMVIVFYHIGASILVNAIAGEAVRATGQTLLVLFGSGLGPMFANGVAGRLAETTGSRLQPLFIFGAVLSGLAAVLVGCRGRRLARILPGADLRATLISRDSGINGKP